jgi:hypothetical protein
VLAIPAGSGLCSKPMSTLAERFWAKVDQRGPMLSPYLGPCWVWTGSLRPNGYGQIQRGRRGEGVAKAHRVAFELMKGPIPAGLEPDHLCRRGETGRVLIARQRDKTHCPQGHPYDEANTWRHPVKGWRQCRTCSRSRQRV